MLSDSTTWSSSHCVRARGGSTLQSALVVGEGEVGFGGIGSVEAKKSGADDYRVQDEVHDPEESANVLGRSEGTAHRLAEAGGQSNPI